MHARGEPFSVEIHSAWGFFLNLAPNMWGNRKKREPPVQYLSFNVGM
jgi:hypothetical protein